MQIGDLAVDRGADNKIKYNGKELQDEKLDGVSLALYDFGKRYKMNDIPVFTTIDPLAERFNFQSPYVYANNNPIKYIDFNGEGAVKGPFSSSDRVYKTNFGVRATRITTDQRRMMSVSQNVMYTFCKGGAIMSVVDNYRTSNSGMDYAETTGKGILTGAGHGFKAAMEYGAKDVGLLTKAGQTLSNLGKGTGNLMKGIGIVGIVNTATDNAPTRQESLEAFTFKIGTISMGANENIANEGLLDFYNQDADVGAVQNGLNAVYSVLNEALSEYDLTTNEGISAAKTYVSNNYQSIIKSVMNLLNENNQEERKEDEKKK